MSTNKSNATSNKVQFTRKKQNMSTNKSNATSNKVQFTIGKPVFVWKATGCKEGKNGPTTSERTGSDYADIDPSEPLMVITKYGSSKALCERANRNEGDPDHRITVHINHINPASPYYANRAAKEAAAPLTKEQLKAQAEAEFAAAAARLESLKASEPEVQPATSQEDRDEAASLFEASNG